ncbi:hypothetical protein JCM8547_003750 [Rhodosporidiobolus lusitaniae]
MPPSVTARRRTPRRWLAATVLLGTAATGVRGQSASGILLDEIDTLFAFGDSYTHTGYEPAKGINIFPGYGNTSSGGFVWSQYLTTPSSIYDSSVSTYNPNRTITLYDLAYSGSTTNASIIQSSDGTPDFVDQVEIWEEYFSPPTRSANWTSERTLFAAWFGINDVGFAYLQNRDFAPLLDEWFDTWNRLFAVLYAGGARNFLVLGVPPTQRTPLVQSYGSEAEGVFEANVNAYNLALTTFVTSIPSLYPGSKLALFDTQPFFNTILDSPLQYGFLETQAYCEAYAGVDDDPMVELAECAWPMREYFWYNAYHPTYPVHRLLATVLANTLSLPSNATSVITTTSLLPTSSGASLSSTILTSLSTTVLDSTAIPTTSLTNTVPAEAPTVTGTATVTASGGVGGGMGEGGSNGAELVKGGREKVLWAIGVGTVAAVGMLGWA